MSFRPDFNNFTFQNIPPPPYMTNPYNYGPQRFTRPPPPQTHVKLNDADYLKSFETKIQSLINEKPKLSKISEVRDNLRKIAALLNKIHAREKMLKDNIKLLSDDEWTEHMENIKSDKVLLEGFILQINDSYLEGYKKALAKRAAKRMRQKRIRLENKREREDRKKLREEMSRKIDENLQKIKDEIEKAKKDEESKLQSDVMLREVTRKKHDAKRSIAKLEAMVRLRRARANTAKGRGENFDPDSGEFAKKIEKLKLLWQHKLKSYEKEEKEIRTKLSNESESRDKSESDVLCAKNLCDWREYLFGEGGLEPQVDFKGDFNKFVYVRSEWDKYIDKNGSSIPMGWVVPPNN